MKAFLKQIKEGGNRTGWLLTRSLQHRKEYKILIFERGFKIIVKYRADIDGLRAIAVLMVVIYHFKKNIGFHGFMGVDIFFVISGYLITSIIYTEAIAGRFSVAQFYERRVRRIFPALFTVILVTIGVAAYLLQPVELLGAAKSSIAALFFVSNILFYTESGYFDSAAELKPLLHTWSLAVEEQYYIVFPLLLAGLVKWKKAWLKPAVISVFVLSFLYSLLFPWVIDDGAFAFFMFPTRAWELMAGAFLALSIVPISSEKLSPRTLNILSFFGLALIVLGVSFDVSEDVPYSVYLLPVVIGTALLIYTGMPGHKMFSVNRGLGHPAMTFFGKISYSLYLWHWPVYVFAEYYAFGSVSLSAKIGLILLSILLAYLSWKYVEQPFRDKRTQIFSVKNLSFGMAVSLAIIASSLWLIAAHGRAPWFPKEQMQFVYPALGGGYQEFTKFETSENFVFGAAKDIDQATILLIGDSHAKAIAPAIDGFAKEHNETAVMLRNSCLAMPGSLGQVSKLDRCLKISQEHVDFVKDHPSIKTVIIAQRWLARTQGWRDVYGVDKSDYLKFRKDSLAAFVKALDAPGRQIVIVAQVPRVRAPYENIPSMYARLKSRDVLAAENMHPLHSVYLSQQKNILSILREVAQDTHADLVRPDMILCPQERCELEDLGGFFYWDDDHLSRYGAEKMAPLFAPYFK